VPAIKRHLEENGVRWMLSTEVIWDGMSFLQSSSSFWET
jgi:hypothetical protein